MVPSNHTPAATSTAKKPSITAFSRLRLPWSSGGSGPPSVIGRSRLGRIEMNVAAIVDDTIARFLPRFTLRDGRICRRSRILLRQIAGPDRRLAVPPWNIEHIFRLAQTGHPSPQCTHQFLPVPQRRAQMRGAGREIAMMQVIGFDAAFD